MSSGTIFLLLLLLACPLMMLFMHRGGHGAQGGHSAHTAEGQTGRGCGHGGGHSHSADTEPTLDELQKRREELDAEIERLEVEETRPTAPLAG